jgi:eukaryotic-like serine/threonine-protein kinase
MQQREQPIGIVRFGSFELDLQQGKLSKSGIRIRLQEQPLQILALLLQHPGQLVTREEIRQKLWERDTFVEFDDALNTAVRKLRAALNDSADNPRFLETVPRRGYRFIAPVAPTSESQPVAPAKPVAPQRNPYFWVAALLVVAVAGVAGYRRFHRRALQITSRDTIVLADFANSTGDTVFDDALKQALAVELGQSPFLNVLSDRKVSETWAMMGHSTSDRITVDAGRELCLRTGSKAVLGGTISSLGSHYLIDLLAIACGTDDTLAREQVEATSKEDVLKVLSRASSSLRTKLGESLPSVQKFDVPIEATTASLDALKNYSLAMKISREKGDAPGIPFLKRAIELDPNFPMAYAQLAIAYGNLSQPSLGLDYATKAYQLRNRVTEREKFRISAAYFRATGEVQQEVQIYELWIANYPRESVAHENLGANYFNTGQYDGALAEFQEGASLAPDHILSYANLGAAYLCLNRLNEAKATFDEALARRLDGGWLRENMYYLAFLRQDALQMRQQVAWGAGKPGDEDALLSKQSDTEAYYGRLKQARDFSRQAVISALRSDSKEAAAYWQLNAALREAELGNTASAKQGVTVALALSSGRDVKVAAALALARLGDAPRANALAEELKKNYPSNTLLNLYWLPTVDAAIQLRKANSSQALVDLESAVPYELGGAGTFISYLYPVYVRGQAYLLAHNGTAAAAEFQKMADHRGIVQNFVTGALAHLQIARAYAMAGDTPRAKAGYQDFLTLWKDADPDIPILKQAKLEYAKLQ